MILTNFNASLPCTLNSYHFYLISKFLIKKPITNNGPLKHSASDFTQLQSGIVRDLECCWVTVQSAFLSIKCLRASDRAQKRGNGNKWDCFNSITLKGRINASILFAKTTRERVTPCSKSLLQFSLCLCSCKNEMCHFLTGSIKPWKCLTWEKRHPSSCRLRIEIWLAWFQSLQPSLKYLWGLAKFGNLLLARKRKRMKNKLTLIAQTVEQIFPHQDSGSPAPTPVGSGSQPVAVLMGGMLRAGHWGFSQAAQNNHECSVEENYLMFLHINSECCARFLIFFSPAFL